MALTCGSTAAQVASNQSFEKRSTPSVNESTIPADQEKELTLAPEQTAAPSSGASSGDQEPKSVAISSTSDSKESDKTAKKKEKKERRGEIVAAPLPISSPAIGSGIIPVAAYIFPFSKNDKVSPPSVVGFAGLITNNGSRLWALGGQLFLNKDTWQVTTEMGHGNLNYNFYGTGNAAGNAGRKLALIQTGTLFMGEVLRRVGWKIFVGPRFWVGNSTIAPNLEKSDTDHPNLSQLDLATNVRAVGLRALRDTRPNRFYPTQGTLTDLSINFFSVNSGLENSSNPEPEQLRGQSYSFQSYRFIFNDYNSLGKRQVLATNLYVCGIGGEAPFYGQCIFGTSNELRGYTAGRYIDRRMLAGQVEYRLSLPMRLGLVGFAGVGEVGPSFGKFDYDNLLPSIGTGLRFLLEKKYHVNLRVDIAEGKDGHTWSMGVGEAF
jgi:surface antigen Omp85-like protein